MTKDAKTQGMKPDKLCHTGPDYKTAKEKPALPGQMYVPKTNHSEVNALGTVVNK
jgi:hypothetical protein